MKRFALTLGVAAVLAATPGTSSAVGNQAEPGCYGQWHSLAAHVLDGLGPMISTNASIRKGPDNGCLGQDINPYLRDAVCS